LLAKLADLA